MDKKDVYIGYVGEKKTYDSGVVKYPISFKIEQLEEMKKYATAAGNVNVDFVIKIDGAAFTSVFNPRAAGGNYSNSNASKAVETKESDMPF
jgi:hypothetical protein|tara:strand:+ start:3147 stop:3419 length:273 start_codon:yes stop_codon:yes gene_type:complete